MKLLKRPSIFTQKLTAKVLNLQSQICHFLRHLFDCEWTTAAVDLFQTYQTPCVKLFLRILVVSCSLLIFEWWPLSPFRFLDMSNRNSLSGRESWSLYITLDTCMRSPRSLLWAVLFWYLHGLRCSNYPHFLCGQPSESLNPRTQRVGYTCGAMQ